MSDDPSDSRPGPTPTADSSPGPGIHAGDVRHDDNGAMEPPSPAVMATSTASGVTTRQQPSQHHHESSYSVGMQEPVPPHAQTLASETQVMQELSLPLPMQMPAPGAHEAQIPRMHMQVTQRMQMMHENAQLAPAAPPLSGSEAHEMMTRLAASEQQTLQLQQQLAQTLRALDQERLERLPASFAELCIESSPVSNSPAAAGFASAVHAGNAGWTPAEQTRNMTRARDGGVSGEVMLISTISLTRQRIIQRCTRRCSQHKFLGH